MSDRQKVTEAVFIALLTKDKVLLQLRQNTGWLDGSYDLPSGHIEAGEDFLQAAVREAFEESGIKLNKQGLELFHVSQHAGSNKGAYTYLMFKATNWEGEPTTKDPDKVAQLGLFPLNSLPTNTVPYVARALADINSPAVTFSYFGSDGIERKN